MITKFWTDTRDFQSEENRFEPVYKPSETMNSILFEGGREQIFFYFSVFSVSSNFVFSDDTFFEVEFNQSELTITNQSELTNQSYPIRIKYLKYFIQSV